MIEETKMIFPHQKAFSIKDTLQSIRLTALHEIVERIMDREKVCASDILKRYETYYTLSQKAFVDDRGAIYFAMCCIALMDRIQSVYFRPCDLSRSTVCSEYTLASSSLAKPHQRRVD